jgi:Ca2+-binding EF-hand superfamily protein
MEITPELEATLRKLFETHDTDRSGLIDLNELQQALLKVGVNLDSANAGVLLKRYDEKKKGKLTFEEFEELYLLVLKLQKYFHEADADKSNTLNVKEITVITQKLGLKVTAKAIGPVLKIFDENGNGTADFQEYLAVIFFFQELEFQYDYYVGEPANYDWVSPLLPGADNQKKVPDLIKDLKKWKEKKKVPTFEEFVKLFVESLEVNVIVKFFTRRKVVAPKIEVVRDRYRIKAPKRHIKAPPPPIISAEEQAAHGIDKLHLYDEPEEEDHEKKEHVPAQPAPHHEPLPVVVPHVEPAKIEIPPVVVVPHHVPHVEPAKIEVKAVVKIEEPKPVPKPVKPPQPWNDPGFPANDSVLPASAKGEVTKWKRIKEINENGTLFVKGVDEGDVIQGALGDCWFLSALAVVATSTDNFIEQLFTQQKPEIGFYQVRFYKNGKWRLVDVDDRLPCDDSGLYFAKCRDPTEFWVPIIEKAYAKLHGSYDALEAGSIADGLKDLTGEAVEVLLLDSANFQKKHTDLWAELLHNLKESFLMGCSKEVGNVEAETELDCGLLVNHAYSIIDAQEVSGNKLVRVRNPWGRGEWTGAWGDNSKQWTPALMKHFEYDFADDGTFFMSYEDFVKNYNRIYVLRLLVDSEGEAWKKKVFNGEFKGESAGGCTSNPTWHNNPQFALTVEKPTKVFLNFSQPDLRYVHKKKPEANEIQYHPIGTVVLAADTHDYKKTSVTAEERVAGSQFGGMRDNSLEFVAEPGVRHVIIPSAYHPGAEFEYELCIYTQYNADVREITKALPVKKINGVWKGPTAGGCQNQPTFLKNPQYELVVDAPGTVIISLTQELSGKQTPEATGIYVFKKDSAARVEVKPPAAERAVSPKDFTDSVSTSEKFQAKDGVHYIVMPTTFDPNVERGFILSVSSPDTTIKTFSLIH